jgi:hypothetical protein
MERRDTRRRPMFALKLPSNIKQGSSETAYNDVKMTVVPKRAAGGAVCGAASGAPPGAPPGAVSSSNKQQA